MRWLRGADQAHTRRLSKAWLCSFESLKRLLVGLAPYVKSEEQLADPWGNPYQYRLNGNSGYQISTFGEDRSEGGSDEGQDIY